MIPCYVFDVDGTLADITHRLRFIRDEKNKDWGAFFAACGKDSPILPVCRLAADLSGSAAIVLVSGRSEVVRAQTDAWVRTVANVLYTALYMRAEGDHRGDETVKAELLDRLRIDGFEPLMVFDDRSRVVAMWRAKGITCAQVADGDF